MAEKIADYKAPRLISTLLQLCLVAEIAASAIVAIVFLLGANGPLVLPPVWHALYLAVVRSLYVTPLCAGIGLLFWLYRVCKNARILSSQTLETTPGWAVGWYFIPFANLWKPYGVMREIYKASRNPLSWRQSGQASIVGLWWAINLFGNFVGLWVNILTKSEGADVRVPGLLLYLAIVIHQSLLLLIVRRVGAWQARARKSHGVEDVF